MAMLMTLEEVLRTAREVALLSWQRQANWKGLQTRNLLHSFPSHGSLPSTVAYTVCTPCKYTYIKIKSYGLPTRLHVTFVFLSLGCLISHFLVSSIFPSSFSVFQFYIKTNVFTDSCLTSQRPQFHLILTTDLQICHHP